MRILVPLFRFIFALLYHQFAWCYDLVAAVVSLGRWQDWVLTALPHLDGRVLELGFGPGHLQAALHKKGALAFGLDESRQMLRQAERRLACAGLPVRLVRGRAQALPFPANSFEHIAATFPSDYIFDASTLAEIYRLLVPGGSLVVVPAAWITGGRLLERGAAWLLRLAGLDLAARSGRPLIEARFVAAGFEVRSEIVERAGSQVVLILAYKGK
ncbi:MAG: class I SAM-dependent methyltransferase [Anaerolineales bacterium]